MLIDLESCSDVTTAINFRDVTSRPTHLPLSRSPRFHPTLPPTPEVLPRSYCSLPARIQRHDDVTTCVIGHGDAHGLRHKRAHCCSWFLEKFQHLFGHVPPKRDVTVHCHVTKRNYSRKVTNGFRKRAATAPSMSIFGKENKREWGVERHDDVIYDIMLKRVQHGNSPQNEVSEGLQWGTHKVRYVKAATLERLVAHLCRSYAEEWGERIYVTVFLATYRSFATADDVIKLVVEEWKRIKREEAEDKRLPLFRSIERLIRTWVKRHFNDFYQPPSHPILHQLVRDVEGWRADTCDVIEADDDLTSFLRTKLNAAELQTFQEKCLEDMNSPGNYVEQDVPGSPLGEVPDNTEATKTFLNDLSPTHVAEQLTLKDANLFMRTIPHHCLDAVRSSKSKPTSVRATIDQFNKEVYCVLSTSLCVSLKPHQRSKILCKWIEVAQVCRELKNFSSLRAIVSGLQTHALHRLKRAWMGVPHSHTELLGELSDINMKALIMKVGTAKVNTEKSSISRVRKEAVSRRQRTMESGIMHGTVPYLGSFLTDLTYLHTAKPDFIENNLINFDKRRKEFELLAQLQLWQASCRSYQHIEEDYRFSDWFASLALLDDEQANFISELIEPPVVTPLSPAGISHKRTISEMISSGLDSSGNSPCGLHSRSQCSDTEPRTPAHPTDTNEDRVIKVEIVRKDDVGRGIPEVKNMTLSSNDRSPAAVKKALKLFDLNEDDAANFALIQILPDDKELRIPDSANVYYAMQSSSDEFHFALMEGEAQYPHQRNPPSSLNGSPATRKKSHRKTLSASGSISTSPMKSLYRLTLGGISLASGSYSPARENEKFENSFEFHALRHQLSPRRDAIIDDLRATSSDSADDESEDAGWRQRMKRIVHGKIHKRTGSDTSRASAESMFEIPPIRRLHARLPARDESTLPRHRVESASTAYTWTRRRAVVRKHHSQPRATRPDDSRSTFYVTSSDERPQSTASMEPINESRDENRSKPLYTRSASDPCVLDLLHGSDSVFEAPSIVVHCASPRKTTFRGEWTSGSSRDGSDCDVINNGKERQSSSDGESTYL